MMSVIFRSYACRITYRLLYIILLASGMLFGLSSCKDSESPTPPSVSSLTVEDGTCANWTIQGTYAAGVPLEASHTMKVEVNVKRAGDYVITTEVVNGYSFSASGNFTTTGIQSIILQGSGTPESGQTDLFTVVIGDASCSISVTVNPEKTPIDQSRIILAVGERFSDSEYYLYALNGLGEVLWTKPGFGRPQVVRNDTLFYNISNTLYAANALTGEEYWSRIYDGSIQGYMAMEGNRFYGADSRGEIFALSVATRNVIWNNPSDIYAVNSSSPTTANGVIYGGSPDDHLYALDENGTLKWRTNVGATIRSSPALGSSLVFVGADDGTLYALSQENGDIVWSQPAGIQGEESPTVYQDNVYIQGQYFIHCFDQSTGDVIWKYEIPGGDGDWSSPTVEKDILYACGTGNGLQAFNAQTGEQLWSTSSQTNSTDSPVVLDGIVYYSSPGGLSAIDATTGADLWNYGYLDPWNTNASVSFTTSPIVYDTQTKETAFPSESGNKQ